MYTLAGSEGLQLAKASQLPQLLGQKVHELDRAEAQLQMKRRENSQKLLAQHKVKGARERPVTGTGTIFTVSTLPPPSVLSSLSLSLSISLSLSLKQALTITH